MEKEALTTGAMLQKPIDVKIAGKTMQVPRPTVATLMEVSALLPELPELSKIKTELEAFQAGLKTAKDCKKIGLLLATLIYGYKIRPKSRKVARRIYERKRNRLAGKLLNACSVVELYQATQELLIATDAGSFFVFIASLTEINLMKEATTTAHSQS